MTLGSETSDISVTEALTISGITEGILSNEADLALDGFVIIDGEGRIKSSGGKISFSNGGRLSGSAELDLTGSDWALGGDFEKRSSTGSESSGTLTLSETNLELEDSIKLTSDIEVLSFVGLSLDNSTLTIFIS